jgi:hypothetical protein
MVAERKDRVRASKIRQRIAMGKSVTAEQRQWLLKYDIDGARRGARKHIVENHAPVAVPRAGRGPQLAVPGTEHVLGGAVLKTAPPSGALDPSAFTWTPTVPELGAGAEPPPPGAPPPPAPGTPIVDAAAASAPQGDPAAAAQFAAFVMFVAGVGVDSVRELVGDMKMPDDARALLMADELKAHVQKIVGASAHNVAMEMGFKAKPIPDKAIVAIALAGSGVAWARAQKRRAELAGNAARNVEPPRDMPPEHAAASKHDSAEALVDALLRGGAA